MNCAQVDGAPVRFQNILLYALPDKSRLAVVTAVMGTLSSLMEAGL
jgi:hypothetical protein